MSEEPVDHNSAATELLAEGFVAAAGFVAAGPSADEPRISIRTVVHELMASLVEFYERNAASLGPGFDVSDPHTRNVVVESLVAHAESILAGMNLPAREELVELALSALGAN